MKLLLLALLVTQLFASQANELKCLQMNIYFEARSSNLADQAAVADVVLNRVVSNNYPNSICEVVWQRKQFSWTHDGKSDRMTDRDAAESAYLLAHQMLYDGRFRGISQGADHYHADYVKAYWAKSLNLIGTIGRHIYYRSN